MRNLLSTWGLVIALAPVAAVPAWAVPGVVNLTTPVLPAGAGLTIINSFKASPGSRASIPKESLLVHRSQAVHEMPQRSSSAIHFQLSTCATL